MPRPWKSVTEQGDADGISVCRAALTTLEATAHPHWAKPAHVGLFAAAVAFDLQLHIIHKPTVADASHAVIPELNSLDAMNPDKTLFIEQWAKALRDKTVLIHTE